MLSGTDGMMVTRRRWCMAAGGALGVVASGALNRLCAAPETPGHAARFWRRDGGIVRCELCPHGCQLSEGKTGLCRNRQCRGGELLALGYGKPCAIHVDPIEKKPFYHMLPGARTYSIGVAGCSLRCKNCQNYAISQRGPLETENIDLSPRRAVEEAKRQNCSVVVFTYTEPSVWIEYLIDTAVEARKAGLATAVVSSGYINEKPFEELVKVTDAVRIDLKSFSDDSYGRLNAGRLQPVLDTLLLEKKCGIWLEVINLVIPGWNDTPSELRALCGWVRQHLGTDTPLHFSRCFPVYQLSGIYPTPVATLQTAASIAGEAGLSYVYIGNVVGGDAATRCPACGKTVLDRSGYIVTFNNLKDGRCGFCNTTIAGWWRK